MKNFSAPTKHLNPSQKGIMLNWWYRIASPPEPQRSAPFEARERFRRGRTGSQVILAVFFVYLFAFPAAIADRRRPASRSPPRTVGRVPRGCASSETARRGTRGMLSSFSQPPAGRET